MRTFATFEHVILPFVDNFHWRIDFNCCVHSNKIYISIGSLISKDKVILNFRDKFTYLIFEVIKVNFSIDESKIIIVEATSVYQDMHDKFFIIAGRVICKCSCYYSCDDVCAWWFVTFLREMWTLMMEETADLDKKGRMCKCACSFYGMVNVR